MLVLIKRVLEKTGKQTLEEVWPNLEVFFHGGVAFTPYREQYKQVITTPKMHYVETYNASEGYFGTQNDLSDPAMLLMIDYGIFYEFVPLEEVDKENPRAYCLEEVELNKNYAMVISTSCGLWRYMIGDTVKFTGKNPYKFVITCHGRPRQVYQSRIIIAYHGNVRWCRYPYPVWLAKGCSKPATSLLAVFTLLPVHLVLWSSRVQNPYEINR